MKYRTKDGQDYTLPGIGRTVSGIILTDHLIENPNFELVEDNPQPIITPQVEQPATIPQPAPAAPQAQTPPAPQPTAPVEPTQPAPQTNQGSTI